MKILFSKRKHCVKCSHLPTLTAHCARPEPTQHISHGLIPHCFSRPFIPCTADVLLSSPTLILPRAEHSSPYSNTASRAPVLFQILPVCFAFLPSVLIFTPSLCAVLPPLECRGTFSKSCGGENDALCTAAVVLAAQGQQNYLVEKLIAAQCWSWVDRLKANFSAGFLFFPHPEMIKILPTDLNGGQWRQLFSIGSWNSSWIYTHHVVTPAMRYST